MTSNSNEPSSLDRYEKPPSLSAEPHLDVQLETPPAPRLVLTQWLQILSTFMVFFNTWGLLLTFGVFQTYYERDLLVTKSSSEVSWISTTCAFILLSAGIVTGPLYDQGYYRILLLSGSLLQVFGLMMVSLSTNYYQLILSQGICVGIGAGIVFTPSVAAASACLKDPATRAKAMGLMACGSSIGGIIYPIMFRNLVPDIGFPWTVRSIAFVMLGLYLISYTVLMKDLPKPIMVRRRIDISALKDLPFMVLSVASLFSSTAFYIPLLYLPLLSKVRIPSIDTDMMFDLLAILNGASVVGRLLVGALAAKYGATETITVCLFFGSIQLFSWIAVDSLAGVIVWAVFWGMTSGALVTLPGALIPLFSPSLAEIGTRSGMYWVWIGIGLLIGSPIGGALYDVRSAGDNYWHLQVFAGVFMMVAAILTVYPVMHTRRKARNDMRV